MTSAYFEIETDTGCSWEKGEYNVFVPTQGPVPFDFLIAVEEEVDEWVQENLIALEAEVTYVLKISDDVDGFSAEWVKTIPFTEL